MKKEDTKLDIFTFGDKPADIYYCLVDKAVSPKGLDLEKVRLLDPRNFDQMMRDMGCLIMLTQEEIHELARRGELNVDDLHSELFRICKREGIIR